MRVLLVNTSELAGGAAMAARRLMTALEGNGVEVRMLVRDKASDDPRVITLPGKWLARWHFLYERMVLLVRLRFNRKHLFAIDAGISGTDITRMKAFQEADVVHLHWVNQGMLSLADLRKIIRSGKPVVWTMHDAWPATALCHLTLDCRQFARRGLDARTSGCRNCPYLPGGGSADDYSSRVWRRKQRMLAGGNVTFVACSRWLEGEAKASALLRGQHIVNIPNPIDNQLFSPGVADHASRRHDDQQRARRQEGLPLDRRLVLFVCQRVTNPYKGMDYLIDACRQMAEKHPYTTDDIAIMLLGSHADEVASQLPYPALPLGYVADEQRMARLYRAADVFVLPSLSENLPNTIMEAMACGVPCLGFRVGGIPEEIDHRRTGYVARYRDAADLAKGLHWLLYEADTQKLADEAVRKVARCYSPASVAVSYTEIYQQAMIQSTLK